MNPNIPRQLHDIAFLHTSTQHVETFSDLVSAIAPSLHVLHIVREDLLIDALQPCIGIGNAALVGRIKVAVQQTARTGASVIVCTCSTIGGIVEALKVKSKKRAITTTRIDRAMADAAVQIGAPILLIAALESTIAPSQALLQSSAAAIGANIRITPILLSDAWAHFLAGDKQQYINAIIAGATKATAAELTPEMTPTPSRAAAGMTKGAAATAGTGVTPSATRSNKAQAPIIVLAQASMHAAVAPLAALGITALSSPEYGVRHAVTLCAQQNK